MSNGSLVSYPEVYRALLDKFKMQYDVKMYIRLPDYDDFRDFDLPNEMASSAISKRFLRDLRYMGGQLLNSIYPLRASRRNRLYTRKRNG